MSAPRLKRTAAPRLPGHQKGAVLYIALIMLVLVALIGITAMRVAGLQERMSSNYYAINRAFQNAEGLVRLLECRLEDIGNRTATPGCASPLNEADISLICNDGYDAGNWVDGQQLANAPQFNVRKIDGCVAGEASIAMGVGPGNEVSPILIYQITAYEADTNVNETSASAVDTVFKF